MLVVLTQFLHGTVRQSPDIYLDEIRQLLEDRRGVVVSDATAWRALRRSGFTMKKVSAVAALS